MKGRWRALAFGAVWVIAGWLVARPGLSGVFGQEVPRPPGGWEALAILGGGLLILIGLVLGLTPHIIWALRSFYKEDFAPEARCPIMLICPACREYNHRGRLSCARCTGSLAGARAAGGATAAASKGPPTPEDAPQP